MLKLEGEVKHVKMGFNWLLYVAVIASVIITPSSSMCVKNESYLCNYTVTCTGSLDRVKNLNYCGSSHYVTFIITETEVTILEKSFFSPINFESRVRHIMATANKWTTIAASAFRYYDRCIEMDLSNNQISKIENLAFGNLTDLKFLNLSRNSIRQLMPRSFDLTGVEVLDLSHNQLTALNSELNILFNLTKLYLNNNNLESLSDASFQDLVELNYLYLQHNRLKSFGNERFNINHLITLDLSFNQLTYVEMEGVGPVIRIKVTNVDYLNLNNNEISGDITEATFSGISLVTELELTEQSITGIINKAFKNMPRLLSLNLSKNSIRTVENTSFVDASIRILDLSHNKLQSLSFLKNCLTNLTEFIISYNDIQVISENAFESQTQIVNLDLSMNKIVKIEPKSLPLLKLQFLNITGNQLTGTVGRNVFSPAKYLISLDLTHTNITGIGDMAFVDLPVLERLNLSRNQIENIKPSNFKGVTNMASLDLSHNKLTNVKSTNNTLNSLNALYLNNNYLTDVSGSNVNMIYLDASNKILPNLTKLDLSHNKIKNFNNPKINSLSTLVDLKVASNGLTAFNVSYFKYLKTVDLSNNNISHIYSALLGNNKYLESIDISRNKITVLTPGAFRFTKNLKSLNLSANFLSQLRHGTLSGLVNTEMLDLSRNNLTSLDENLFHECTKLETLIIDYNRIKLLDLRTMFYTASPKLTTISLGGNRISCTTIFNAIKYLQRPFNVTSIDTIYDEENVYGIKCGDDVAASTTQPEVESESSSTTTFVWCAVIAILILCSGAVIIRKKFYKTGYLGFPIDTVSRTALELD